MVVDEALQAGMRRLGASDVQIAQVLLERGGSAAQDPNVCEVWPENWAVWEFFMRAQTQWCYAGGGMGPAARVALNYVGVEAVARLRGVPHEQLQGWADALNVIELAVLQADHELAAKRAKK